MVPARLRFGLFMQPIHHPRENPTLALERDLQLLEHLDQLGFDEAWIGEHHSTGWENVSAPDIFIAAAAARTRSIKLGTGVVQLAIHHPFHVLDRMILLDHLTRGRAMLGVGVGGGLPSDLHVFGLDSEQAYPRFQQGFEFIMQMLDSYEPLTVKTDWFEVRDAVLQLRPYSDFTMAIASDSPTSLEMVGRYGARLLSGSRAEDVPGVFAHMQRGAEAAGRTADRSQISLVSIVHLAETRQQAIDEVHAKAAEEQFEFSVGVNARPAPKVDREQWVEQVMTRGIIGTPDDAIERIESMLEVSGGFGGLLLQSKEWASRESIWRSYELFARYVMPHFQGTLRGMQIAAATASQINHAKLAQPV